MMTEDCLSGRPMLGGVCRRRTLNRQLILAGIVAVSSLSPVFLGPLPSFGADDVPPSPREPWYPSKLRDYEAELAREAHQNTAEASGITADPDIVYDLPALVDIAERSNPQTRIAWERARQAAAEVGKPERVFPVSGRIRRCGLRERVHALPNPSAGTGTEGGLNYGRREPGPGLG